MTSALLSEALAPLRASPERTAILLDIDGTLAPIVDNAADAHVPETTRQLLIAVAHRYRLMACVSGRRASEARAMVSIGAISYIGSHGAELLRAGWTEAVLDKGLEEWVRRIQEFGREADTADVRKRRVRLEDKGAIVAFHWRGAPDEEAARAAIEAIAKRAQAAGLATHWGRKVLEVRPPVKIDKGAGIISFLNDAGEGIDAALYVGDDTTDLDAFRALRELLDEGKLERVVRVGVASDEGPSAVTGEADLVVDGTEEGCAGCCRCWPPIDVRFAEFLRTTVLISLAAASALALITLIAAANSGDGLVLPVAIGWWVIAGAIGMRLGRRNQTSSPIATLLASARMQPSLPEVDPARTLLNRLWPLLVSTLGAGVLGFVLPQVPAIACGFAIIWALGWRRQASAVTAIEERDGARFYVERTSPLKRIKLVRTPGFRTNLLELNGASASHQAQRRA